MSNPSAILDLALQKAEASLEKSFIEDTEIAARVEYVSRYVGNRAVVRLLLACSLAAMDKPDVDIRKPYTEIPDDDTYSGRTYDESYITAFVSKHNLPCNSTTAFLTPALRNRDATFTPGSKIVGRPAKLYDAAVQLLNDVYDNAITAEELLVETVRCLLIARNEKQQRMKTLLAELQKTEDAVPLSVEEIVTLLQQHLACRHSSRLPVLIVAAAYSVAEGHLGERVLPLEAHNAADQQTGSLGDLEITLVDDDAIVTSYEMKTRRVTSDDIDRALQKIDSTGKRVDNYVFITTDVIEIQVAEYAASMYDRTGGIEIVILDCISFVRHFLHLFHRLRAEFLEQYQDFVLAEPDSAVGQPLKEALLALRHAAESSREM